MDISDIQRLLKENLRLTLKDLKKTKPLYKGGSFTYESGGVNGRLLWYQTLPERYRGGLKLGQRVKVRKGFISPSDDNETLVVWGWHPHPDYILVLLKSHFGSGIVYGVTLDKIET